MYIYIKKTLLQPTSVDSYNAKLMSDIKMTFFHSIKNTDAYIFLWLLHRGHSY